MNANVIYPKTISQSIAHRAQIHLYPLPLRQMPLTMWAISVQLRINISGSDRVVAASCCTMHRCHHPKTPGHLGPMVSCPVGICTPPTWLQSFLIGSDPMGPHGRGEGAAARSGAKEIQMTLVCTLYDFVDAGQPMARLWNSLVDIDCKPQWIDVCSFCARQKRTRKQKGSSMPQDMKGSRNKIPRSSLYASALAPSHQQIPSTKPWLVADLTKSSKCQQSGNKCVFETEENESLQNLKESLKLEATWSHFELQLTKIEIHLTSKNSVWPNKIQESPRWWLLWQLLLTGPTSSVSAWIFHTSRSRWPSKPWMACWLAQRLHPSPSVPELPNCPHGPAEGRFRNSNECLLEHSKFYP